MRKKSLLSVFNLKVQGNSVNLTTFLIKWNNCYETECSATNKEHLVDILTEEWDNSLQHMPVLNHIAGHCCYSVCKKLQCEAYKTKITSLVGDVGSIKNVLISQTTRGGLLYPWSDIVHIVKANYITVNKLAKADEFKLTPSQHQLVHITMFALDEEDFLFYMKKPVKITEMLIWSCSNILLKNLCFENSDNLAQEKQGKKGKLQTVL